MCTNMEIIVVDYYFNLHFFYHISIILKYYRNVLKINKQIKTYFKNTLNILICYKNNNIIYQNLNEINCK